MLEPTLLVSNLTIDELYQQITQLTVDVKSHSQIEDYVNSNESLKHRLDLLNQLAQKISVFESNAAEYRYYLDFLKKLKDDDEQEVLRLGKERIKVIVENTQQKKRSKAVNLYQNISLDK